MYLAARSENVPFPVHGTLPSDLDSRRNFAWAANTIFLFLSTLTMGLRFYARRILGRKMQSFDWLIIAGYILALMPSICIYVMLENGLGYHMANLTKPTITSFLKATFALQRANQPTLACIKISILLFYISIFRTRTFKIIAYVQIAYTLLWAIIGWCVNLTVCHPVSYFYDRTTAGYCGSQQISGSVNGGLGVLGDVLILLMPLFMIRKLQLNNRKKIAVSGMFLLGAFVCVASGLRIWAVSQAAPQDVSYAQATAATWTAIEMQVAIVSANLPTLGPLFERFLRNRKNTGSGSGGMPPSAYGTGGGSYAVRIANNKSAAEFSATLSHNRSDSKSLSRDGFKRISDELDYPPSNANSTNSLRDLQDGDRAILVKTEIRNKYSSNEQADQHPRAKGSRRPDEFELKSARDWEQRH